MSQEQMQLAALEATEGTEEVLVGQNMATVERPIEV